MSWLTLEGEFIDENDDKIKEYQKKSYNYRKRLFREIGKFSKDNHIVLSMYKHGGTPIGSKVKGWYCN